MPSSLEQLKARRDAAIEDLSEAFAADTIDMAEFERRLAVVHRAEDLGAIETTTADLPKRTLGPSTVPTPVVKANVPAVVAPPRILAVLGATTRSGPWTPPRTLHVKAVAGAVELDLRDAVLSPGVTEINVSAVFGAIDIIVPPELAVEVEGTGVLGAFEHIQRAPAHPDPERPLLRIRGLACFGAVDVRTRLRAR